MMTRVTCKFVVQSASEPVLTRKLSTGGCTSASPGDQVGDTGIWREYGNVAYEVVNQRNLQLGPVMGNYNKPESENFKFFSATPSGQLQLFSVINCDHFKPGQEVYLHLEVLTPEM
ncbi:MAG: hypothetical protein HC933_11430 [Pleurocapsa sp. SU_196_0]|nr:hypothetical protein [Pleurocapsa sp. SU_196_0]